MQPILRAARVKTHTVSAFKGIWRAGRAPEGYFADAVNLTSAQYPALSTRAQRRVINDCAGVTAMYSHDRMLWLDGTALYYGDDEVGALTAGEKQFASMGANVVIYPDKKLLNTRTLSLTSLDNLVTVTGASASASHADGSAASATSYAKLAAAGIGAGFRAGDAVRISGFTSEELNGTFILQTVADDFVVILALAGEGETAAGEVTLSREAPDLDFICAYGNRVWGVSNAAHAVYACKLGDPTNWNAFEGISTDSYAAVVPSPGAFTGMSAYLGSVMLFKEEEIVKLFGTKPSNFQLVSSQMPGVEKGGARSLAFSDSTLFYKGVNGIYAYDGATPVCISRALGDARRGAGRALLRFHARAAREHPRAVGLRHADRHVAEGSGRAGALLRRDGQRFIFRLRERVHPLHPGQRAVVRPGEGHRHAAVPAGNRLRVERRDGSGVAGHAGKAASDALEPALPARKRLPQGVGAAGDGRRVAASVSDERRLRGENRFHARAAGAKLVVLSENRGQRRVRDYGAVGKL